MAENSTNKFDAISRLVQVLSVVVGVVISILSFNITQQKEAVARKAEAEARTFELQKYQDQRRDVAERQKIEAAKPFLELRQKLYLEAIQAAGVLTNPNDHTPAELAKARKRFRQLYVSELSMVEGRGVETSMKALAGAVDPELLDFTPQQSAAYNLSHALRDSLVNSWKVEDTVVDNPKQ